MMAFIFHYSLDSNLHLFCFIIIFSAFFFLHFFFLFFVFIFASNAFAFHDVINKHWLNVSVSYFLLFQTDLCSVTSIRAYSHHDIWLYVTCTTIKSIRIPKQFIHMNLGYSAKSASKSYHPEQFYICVYVFVYVCA